MCGRLLSTLLAVLATLVLGVGTAPAAVGLSVTPGGPFTGAGGPVDPPLTCAGSQIAGMFNTDGNSLGFIDEISYQNCSAGGFLTIEISPHFPWVLQGIAHSNGVTSIAIDDIAADISGPGCNVVATGSVAATFDNATSILTVVEQNTMITFVDPANDCLGLISQGEHVSLLSNSYFISPPQVIEPA